MFSNVRRPFMTSVFMFVLQNEPNSASQACICSWNSASRFGTTTVGSPDFDASTAYDGCPSSASISAASLASTAHSAARLRRYGASLGNTNRADGSAIAVIKRRAVAFLMIEQNVGPYSY